MVNFWASWCPPCREETPDLIAAHRRWGDTVRFIGVDLSDDRDGATSFIDEFGVPYPSVFDPSNLIAVSYGLFSPPATLFFDANGTLRQDGAGPDLRPGPRDQYRGDRHLTGSPSGLWYAGWTMAAVCDICGKKPWFGKSVTFSHKRNNRRWDPNIQRVRALDQRLPKACQRVYQLHQGRQGRPRRSRLSLTR